MTSKWPMHDGAILKGSSESDDSCFIIIKAEFVRLKFSRKGNFSRKIWRIAFSTEFQTEPLVALFWLNFKWNSFVWRSRYRKTHVVKFGKWYGHLKSWNGMVLIQFYICSVHQFTDGVISKSVYLLEDNLKSIW